ncbi:MAG: 4Fe-4S dicluster domain-containing protein [Thermoplasmata archaeon]|nr:MAG: 4Fe-4S dicluster domain-containing protein [Thermoplasmata archaeon]
MESSQTTDEKKAHIEAVELDPNFKFEISKESGGENITSCFQCGTCVAVCPVAAKNPEYDPRKIIWMALLGLRDEVLSSKAIWLCSTCYSCYVRCPQNVKITSVMSAIQNIASREGHVHPSYEAGLEMLKKTGRTVELSEFENQKREKLNCPPIEENALATIKILDETGILKKKEKNKKKGEEG